MMEYISVDSLAWMAIFSVAAFLMSIFIVPWLIVQLPADYFINERRKKIPWSDQHILLRFILLMIKNLLGYIIVVAGIIMLVLPGQGILSIIIGLMLMDFPGKFRFERWLVKREPVLTISNKLRKVAKKEPFIFFDE